MGAGSTCRENVEKPLEYSIRDIADRVGRRERKVAVGRVSFNDSDNLVGVAAKARLFNAVIGVDAVLALPESRRVHDCISAMTCAATDQAKLLRA